MSIATIAARVGGISLAAALLLGPGVAMADANFHFANGALVTSGAETGNYRVSWKETGLGSTPVTYDLTATASYTFQCFTKSGNKPQGSPNSGGPSDQFAQGTFTPHNGQITASLDLDVDLTPSGVSCQGGGLKLCLTAVSYTNVSLTDTTNNVTAPALPDESASGLEVCGE
jgi:hypothetical protein